MPRNELRLQAGILQPEHREKVRAACRDVRERAMLEVLWVTRRTEATLLRWSDVDFVTGQVSIRRGKGGRADWSVMPASTVEALAAWRAEAAPTDPEAWIFPVPGSGSPARPYTPGGFAKIIQGILTRAGCWFRGLGGCHRLRRTMATEFIRQHPGQILHLQRALRHSSPRTTSIYVHLVPQDIAPKMALLSL